jgi:transporter family protein
MTWVFFVFAGVLIASTASLIQKALLNEEKSDPFVYAIIFQLMTAFVLLPYVLFVGFHLPPVKPLLPYLLLTCLLYGLSAVFYFKGLKLIELSESSILASSKAVWTMLTAVIFLGEPVSLRRILGVILIMASITVIFWKRKKWNLNKGHFFILISVIFSGFAFTNDAFLLNHFDSASYAFLAFLLPSLFLLIIRPKSINKFKLFFDKKRLFLILTAVSLVGMGTLFIYLSYQKGGDASQIVPITEFSIIIVVILSFIFLKERDYFIQKIIGSLLAFIGVLLLIK